MTVRRKEASSSAETTTIVEDSILKFNEWWGGLLQGDVIKRLRQRFEDVRCAELGRYAENRSRVPDDDRRLIERISETLVARILHEPHGCSEGGRSLRTDRARRRGAGALRARLTWVKRYLFPIVTLFVPAGETQPAAEISVTESDTAPLLPALNVIWLVPWPEVIVPFETPHV
jgi:hypothetical protein